MATNEFLEFAGASGASVQDYVEYVADTHREIGNQPGLARSTFVNKAMQQTSKIMAVLTQFICDQTGENVLDASTVATIENQLIAAIEASGFSPDDENEFTAHQKMRGDAKIWRFLDTGASGKEWGIRSDGGNFEIVENTGSEAVPVWTVRNTLNYPVSAGGYCNLAASATGASKNVSISADEIVVKDSSNLYLTLRTVSLTVDTTASGANGLDAGALATSTWYSLWVIAKADGTKAGLISLSATAPTLPDGYVYKARVGWIRTDGTANKYPLGFTQAGRRVQYKVASGSNVTALPKMADGSAGSVSTPTWVAVAVGTYLPTTAVQILGFLEGEQGLTVNHSAIVAPSNAYGAQGATSNYPPVNTGNGAAEALGRGAFPFNFLLESTNIYWASSHSGFKLICMGWEDNI